MQTQYQVTVSLDSPRGTYHEIKIFTRPEGDGLNEVMYRTGLTSYLSDLGYTVKEVVKLTK